MNRLVNIAIGVMTLIMGINILSGCADRSDEKDTAADGVCVWRRADIVLRSEKTYENPYADVQIDAVFTHEDGDEISLYGFWNGGDEWRVRFSPTKTGRWSYVVTCTDHENGGLDGVRGELTAVENTGSSATDKHGFVRVSDSGRYFVYNDGEPFYWLGDTNWQAPNYVSLTRCNYPGCGCGNQFRHEVDDRLKKGFTVYQTYFDSAESDGGGQRDICGEPSMWTERHTLINPEAFTEKYDRMFDYLADSGMVIALGFGVHSNTVSSMSREQLELVSRYLTARYASYPVIWITAQEITGDQQFEPWLASARIVEKGDGYGHPQSAHQFPMESDNRFVVSLDGEEWHDFFMLQNGHGPRIPSKSTYRGYWNNGGAKPFVESEANYEDIYCGGFNGYKASRISAWKANLCGSCGFTYGVTGIWANCYSTSGNTGWLGTYSAEPWYMGLDKPGSLEMKYMADFFRQIGFSELIPRFNSSAYSDLSDETKTVASSEDARTYAAYLYNADLSSGKLFGLDPKETYIAKWYDPLTGKYILAEEQIKCPGGVYEIPPKPTRGDWAFLITSRVDLGEFKYEEPPRYASDVPVRENLLLDASADASSYSAAGSEAWRAVDGGDQRWWCASDGSFPQWISFDMGGIKELDTLYLKMYPGTTGVTYSLEISGDGADWEKLIDDISVPVNPGSGTVGGYLGKTYECRHIRVTFSEVIGNWAAVMEAEAYLNGGKKEALPQYPGSVRKPDAFCAGSAVYSADGKLRDSVSCLFDGDISTVWEPFAPEATQTITLDLKEKKELTGIDIVPGEGAVIPGYRIYASEDGEDWTILADSETGGAKTYAADRYGSETAISEKLEGAYRFVRLMIMGTGKGTVKTISEIALYAE